VLSTHEAEVFTYAYPHPAVAADIAIFTLRGGRLAILLIRRGEAPFKGRWALPGGFLRPDENLDACARRELVEETAVETALLRQFGVFSDPSRDPRERVISVAYLALLPFDQAVATAGSDASDTRWSLVGELPKLAFDHASIIETAVRSLRSLVQSGDPRPTPGGLRRRDGRAGRQAQLQSQVPGHWPPARDRRDGTRPPPAGQTLCPIRIELGSIGGPPTPPRPAAACWAKSSPRRTTSKIQRAKALRSSDRALGKIRFVPWAM
jgi:ADP-ribose pyrophosphatase YjhB (NUDIX family)